MLDSESSKLGDSEGMLTEPAVCVDPDKVDWLESESLRDGDPFSRCFRFDSRVFRAIGPDEAKSFESLYTSGVIGQLVSRELHTPVEPSELRMRGYEALLAYPEFPFRPRPSEWPPALLQEAAVSLLKIAQHLETLGLTLRNADLTLFGIDKGGKPVFLGYTSIVEKQNRWFPILDFFKHYLGPLLLMRRQGRLASLVHRCVLVSQEEFLAIRIPVVLSFLGFLSRRWPTRRLASAILVKVLHSQWTSLFCCRAWRGLLHAAARVMRLGFGGDVWDAALLRRLEVVVRQLFFRDMPGRWRTYYNTYDLPAISADQHNWQSHYTSDRSQAVLAVLKELKPSSLLDIGANRGYFSLLAAHLGFEVTAVDSDIESIEELSFNLRQDGYRTRIRPLLSDVMTLNSGDNRRLEADVVLALGLTHHLRLAQLYSWSHIVNTFAGLARRTLITEFKPGTKAKHSGVEVEGELAEDYQLSRFEDALRVRFQSVRRVGTFKQDIEGGERVLLVCCQ